MLPALPLRCLGRRQRSALLSEALTRRRQAALHVLRKDVVLVRPADKWLPGCGWLAGTQRSAAQGLLLPILLLVHRQAFACLRRLAALPVQLAGMLSLLRGLDLGRACKRRLVLLQAAGLLCLLLLLLQHISSPLLMLSRLLCLAGLDCVAQTRPPVRGWGKRLQNAFLHCNVDITSTSSRCLGILAASALQQRASTAGWPPCLDLSLSGLLLLLLRLGAANALQGVDKLELKCGKKPWMQALDAGLGRHKSK